ncbi:hypothetical protein [Aquimarina sp. 2201CG5-10]|uniref:hypothetical protein n=1 Tax=Aquimarina callyspongiae TaxID=3098150 RepID=UPI002AB382C1|nr:hypothetical protein [Aquimarina sp. 2201CG5-10]MDY8135250.1 hypothetical protein [Aquimarina sp. 2201CG5-10]
MKKLFLLLFVLGAGLSVQAQKNWDELPKDFEELYSLATDLNDMTDKVVANKSVISIITANGTVSVEQRLDKSKPAELKHYEYHLLTTAGKDILLQKMNAKRVLEKFHLKLLQLKEVLAENQDADVEKALEGLFN